MKVEGKITLALIFAVITQTTGALIWAGSAQERLSSLERSAIERRPVAERLARVETELEAVRAQLDRIEHKIEQMPQRARP
ncbi:MAG: hypothetical protein V3V03_08435 [Hyphomonadaceae bacterium]